MRVSFLAVDSKREHETGDPVEWQNRITLKSREYTDGNERMVEIRSAPDAPIRYTTDGSDPGVNGGVYEGPFAVPDGARIVLAVTQKAGIDSEVHRRNLADRPEVKPIDRTGPVVWHPSPKGFSFQATRNAYGFINRLKKHGASAGGLRFSVQAGEAWGELILSDDLDLDSERIEHAVEQLRGLVPDGEVEIEAKYVSYDTGQRFFDYVAETRAEYKREDVEP